MSKRSMVPLAIQSQLANRPQFLSHVSNILLTTIFGPIKNSFSKREVKTL
ncbi:MAG: hypothetical protein Q4F97_06335 [Bacteroidales bacterium]|nr:hypothetical protein [Bacteroidales bacterium]